MKLFSIASLFLAAVSPSLGNAESISYGQRFEYEPAREIEFPDFRLKFLGAKPGDFYPGSADHRLGDILEFKVVTPATSQVLTWSSGTGDIAPEVFLAGGKCLWLEVLRSDNYGKLKENEAVVSLDHRKPSAAAN